MKTAILTEGDSEIGFGHVTRCLSIYQAFLEHGHDTELIVHGDQSILSVVHKEKFKILPWIDNLEILKEAIYEVGLIIVDSTICKLEFVKILTNEVDLIGFIDDSRRVNFSSENLVVIDWTPFVESKYSIDLLGGSYLLGANYIALRKAFWNFPEKKFNSKIKEILITMGGSDIRNLSPFLLKTCLSILEDDIIVTVLVGSGFNASNIVEIENFERENSNVRVIYNANENQVLEAFNSADLVISGGGQTLYELARVGVATIAIEIIENQSTDIDGWKEAGFIEFAGRWDSKELERNIKSALERLYQNNELRKEKMRIGKSIVDGQGARRIRNYFVRKADEICI